MSHSHKRLGWGPVYVASVIAVGLAIITYAFALTLAKPPGLQWLVLAVITLLTGSFTVKIPSLSARFSVSETFIFASGLLFGPSAGTLTVVLDALVISFWLDKKTRSASRVLFNVTAPSIAFWIACSTFFALAGIAPGGIPPQRLGEVIAPLFTFALIFFLINTWLVAGALAWERGLRAPKIWRQSFAIFGINYFVGGSIAILLVAYTSQINLTVLSILIPLLLFSYLTFRTAMGRLEDASRHVAQVNEMYMATMETLAMAVDAKDQITHGHIRRVQVFALELAKRLGVSDDQQLKAIAAAALLHDMGKLAIPEHILNKPGKLTSAEFDKMKRHADIGADLLSSVKFPYPVVPIVRHHHENWDGTGYPAGIGGTDIPLGARVLSVVDCFDALTSDRPYRPRLSLDDAFSILMDRRGTMYDPMVVDAFIASYAAIAPAAIKAGQEARSIDGSVMVVQAEGSAPLNQIRDNASEAALLDLCEQDITRAESVVLAVQVGAQCLRQLTPATVYAFFRYNAGTDMLTCECATGDTQGLLKGLTIKIGERITGWCGANRRTSLNSDPALDLGQIANFFTPALRSTVSIPLTKGDRLVAVLTAYSTRSEVFTETHTYAFERVASALLDRLSTLPGIGPTAVVSFPAAKK